MNTEWQPIESAPKDGKPFLVNDAMSLYYDGAMAPAGEFGHPVVVRWEAWLWSPEPGAGQFESVPRESIAFSWEGVDYTTHWRTLPPPPEAQ